MSSTSLLISPVLPAVPDTRLESTNEFLSTTSTRFFGVVPKDSNQARHSLNASTAGQRSLREVSPPPLKRNTPLNPGQIVGKQRKPITSRSGIITARPDSVKRGNDGNTRALEQAQTSDVYSSNSAGGSHIAQQNGLNFRSRSSSLVGTAPTALREAAIRNQNIDDRSSVTSTSTKNSRSRPLCRECREASSDVRPLTCCATCRRHFHKYCGNPSPSTVERGLKFTCGKCIKAGKSRQLSEAIAPTKAHPIPLKDVDDKSHPKAAQPNDVEPTSREKRGKAIITTSSERESATAKVNRFEINGQKRRKLDIGNDATFPGLSIAEPDQDQSVPRHQLLVPSLGVRLFEVQDNVSIATIKQGDEVQAIDQISPKPRQPVVQSTDGILDSGPVEESHPSAPEVGDPKNASDDPETEVKDKPGPPGSTLSDTHKTSVEAGDPASVPIAKPSSLLQQGNDVFRDHGVVLSELNEKVSETEDTAKVNSSTDENPHKMIDGHRGTETKVQPISTKPKDDSMRASEACSGQISASPAGHSAKYNQEGPKLSIDVSGRAAIYRTPVPHPHWQLITSASQADMVVSRERGVWMTAMRYKGITCRFWKQGTCANQNQSDRCQFAHRETGYSQPGGRNSPNLRAFTCPDYKSQGHCDQGRCSFSHYDTGLYVDSRGVAAMTHITCRFYEKKGKCIVGETCRWAHRDTGLYVDATNSYVDPHGVALGIEAVKKSNVSAAKPDLISTVDMVSRQSVVDETRAAEKRSPSPLPSAGQSSPSPGYSPISMVGPPLSPVHGIDTPYSPQLSPVHGVDTPYSPRLSIDSEGPRALTDSPTGRSESSNAVKVTRKKHTAKMTKDRLRVMELMKPAALMKPVSSPSTDTTGPSAVEPAKMGSSPMQDTQKRKPSMRDFRTCKTPQCSTLVWSGSLCRACLKLGSTAVQEEVAPEVELSSVDKAGSKSKPTPDKDGMEHNAEPSERPASSLTPGPSSVTPTILKKKVIKPPPVMMKMTKAVASSSIDRQHSPRQENLTVEVPLVKASTQPKTADAGVSRGRDPQEQLESRVDDPVTMTHAGHKVAVDKPKDSTAVNSPSRTRRIKACSFCRPKKYRCLHDLSGDLNPERCQQYLHFLAENTELGDHPLGRIRSGEEMDEIRAAALGSSKVARHNENDDQTDSEDDIPLAQSRLRNTNHSKKYDEPVSDDQPVSDDDVPLAQIRRRQLQEKSTIPGSTIVHNAIKFAAPVSENVQPLRKVIKLNVAKSFDPSGPNQDITMGGTTEDEEPATAQNDIPTSQIETSSHDWPASPSGGGKSQQSAATDKSASDSGVDVSPPPPVRESLESRRVDSSPSKATRRFGKDLVLPKYTFIEKDNLEPFSRVSAARQDPGKHSSTDVGPVPPTKPAIAGPVSQLSIPADSSLELAEECREWLSVLDPLIRDPYTHSLGDLIDNGEATREQKEEYRRRVDKIGEIDRQQMAKIAARRLANGKLAAEKLAAVKPAEEQLAARKLAVEKLAAEKLAAVKLAEEQLAALKLAAEKSAAVKLTEEKRAAEKIAAHKRTIEQQQQRSSAVPSETTPTTVPSQLPDSNLDEIVDRLAKKGIIFEDESSDEEMDDAPVSDEDSIMFPWQSLDKSSNLFDVAPLLRPPGKTGSDPSPYSKAPSVQNGNKKQIWNNVLLHQLRERRSKFGHGHPHRIREQVASERTAITTQMHDFRTLRHRDMFDPPIAVDVTVTMDEYMGLPADPIFEADGDELALKDGKRELEWIKNGATRARRALGVDKRWYFTR